jgi:hypothetical protein
VPDRRGAHVSGSGRERCWLNVRSGGVGVLFQRLRGVYYPGTVPWSASHTPVVLQARYGVVGTMSEHLCIRAEATYSTGPFWLGTLGARAGIGYAF